MPKKLIQEEFIYRMNIIHPEYDFSDSLYIGNRFKIRFKCKIHGEVEKYAGDLLNGGKCGKCYIENKKEYSYFSKNKWTLEKFIIESNLIHNDKFDYSLVEYKNQRKK